MNDSKLLTEADRVRKHAYAPYSSFQVGAALLTASGEVLTGCNVENLSFGLTMCAERVAVGAAVSKGLKEITVIAIVSDSKEPVVPCGACRQVLAEFNPALRVISGNLAGKVVEFELSALLPLPRQGILG